MSTSSVKTSHTIEMPSLEMLRVIVRPGMPATPRSIGCVICDSTSVALSALARVTTCTWTFVTSGTASMGSLDSAVNPPAMIPRQIMIAMKEFFAAQIVSPLIVGLPEIAPRGARPTNPPHQRTRARRLTAS